MKKIAFVLLITTLSLLGCNQRLTEPGQDESIIFGRFYGECFGKSCIEIFKIEGGKVSEDTLDNYPSHSQLPHRDTGFALLPDAAFEKVSYLPDSLPPQLFNVPNGVIGQPDAGDWGGFYLETNRSGQEQAWLVDTQKDNIPGYLHPFVDLLHSAVDSLKVFGEAF